MSKFCWNSFRLCLIQKVSYLIPITFSNELIKPFNFILCLWFHFANLHWRILQFDSLCKCRWIWGSTYVLRERITCQVSMTQWIRIWSKPYSNFQQSTHCFPVLKFQHTTHCFPVLHHGRKWNASDDAMDQNQVEARKSYSRYHWTHCTFFRFSPPIHRIYSGTRLNRHCKAGVEIRN